MDWMGTIKAVAPTVASALGGPLAGAAVAALGNILGASDATQATIQTAIETGQLTPDHIAEIRKLEMQYQADERERQFKYVELEFKDRDSARQREEAVKDATPRQLAWLIVLSSLVLTACTVAGVVTKDAQLAGQVGMVTGYLLNESKQVLAYYFGSSATADRGQELLSKAPPVQ